MANIYTIAAEVYAGLTETDAVKPVMDTEIENTHPVSSERHTRVANRHTGLPERHAGSFEYHSEFNW